MELEGRLLVLNLAPHHETAVRLLGAGRYYLLERGGCGMWVIHKLLHIIPYTTIVHENLNIQALSRSRLSKGVLDAGWAQFLQILAYKAEEAGRRVVGVDPQHTSQDCPVCGHREKRPLWVREFTCPGCGTPLHRDVAAALNVLARAWTGPSGMGTAWAVPWSRAKPVSWEPRSLGLQSEESSQDQGEGGERHGRKVRGQGQDHGGTPL